MIASVAKALDILQLFSTTQPRLTLTMMSKQLNMPKSTVHHLVSTLVQYGFVEKQDDGSYALGKAIIALTQNVLVNVDLRDRTAPLLRNLADSCHESVYLTVLDGDKVLYVYAVESPQRLLARTAVGDHAPLYCTSVGKAILAFLPSEEVDALYSDNGKVLKAVTPNTFTDLALLKADLAVSRERGYSIDNQEHELNTFCIGAPIFNGHNAVIGACSISGVDPEIVGSRLPELSAAIVHTAQEISRRMGYVPGRMSMVRQKPVKSS
jgi:IclR family transcriptional regulator, acetate operon repressor